MMKEYLQSVLITGNKIDNEKYLHLGIMEEFGEVAGKCKKFMRGDFKKEEFKNHIKKEIGDLTWYLVLAAHKNGGLNYEFRKPRSSNIYKDLIELEKLKALLGTEDKNKKRVVLRNMINTTTNLAWNFGLTMEEITKTNIEKTKSRLARNKIKGSGDER